jgi:hypothetical protein
MHEASTATWHQACFQVGQQCNGLWLIRTGCQGHIQVADHSSWWLIVAAYCAKASFNLPLASQELLHLPLGPTYPSARVSVAVANTTVLATSSTAGRGRVGCTHPRRHWSFTREVGMGYGI